MATIVKVYRKQKGIGWQAIIRRGEAKYKKTFTRKPDAERWAAEQEDIFDMKIIQDPRLAQKVTLAEAFDKYFQMIKIEGSPYYNQPTTQDRKQRARKNLERILGKETSLAEITSDKVAAYRDERLAVDGRGTSTVRNELSLLSTMMTVARTEWRLPVKNPLDDVRRPAPPPGREISLTEMQIEAVLDECKKSGNKKLYPFVLLLLHTGARASEAATRRVIDVDLQAKETIIRKTKSGKPRKIPITDAVRDALQQIETDDYYFLSKEQLKSRRYQQRPATIFRNSWENALRRIKKKHPDFPAITLHDLRHTAGTHLLEAGADIRTVADILGHADIRMTARYTHPSDSHKREAVERIKHLGLKADKITNPTYAALLLPLEDDNHALRIPDIAEIEIKGKTIDEALQKAEEELRVNKPESGWPPPTSLDHILMNEKKDGEILITITPPA